MYAGRLLILACLTTRRASSSCFLPRGLSASALLRFSLRQPSSWPGLLIYELPSQSRDAILLFSSPYRLLFLGTGLVPQQNYLAIQRQFHFYKRSMQQTFHATFARRAMFERRSSVSRCSFTSNKTFIAPRKSPLQVAITSSIAASFEKLSVTVRVIGMSSVELRSDMPFRADICFSTLSTGQIGLHFHDVCTCECDGNCHRISKFEI